jgi:20S proteasome alpha/beta subunit
MTIAAGFVAADGMLLCADRLLTDGYTKQYSDKILTWSGYGITACFAAAGCATVAKMAIEDCASSLNKLASDEPFSDVYSCIRDSVKFIQREYVDAVPIEERQQSRFYLLIVVHTKQAGLRMYSTNDAAISAVQTFECIGAGRGIGLHIMEPLYDRKMTIESLSSLALLAFAAAKDRVDGVGGKSQFISIGRDGLISPIVPHDGSDADEHVLEFSENCNRLLLDIANKSLADSEFSTKLDKFIDEVRFMRALWLGGMAPFQEVNRQLEKRYPLLTEGLLSPELTKAAQSLPQPSPESPGESNES